MWRFVLGAKRAIGLKCPGTTSAVVQVFPSDEPASFHHYGTSSSSLHSDGSHHRFYRSEERQWNWDSEVGNYHQDGFQLERSQEFNQCQRFDNGSEHNQEHDNCGNGPERDWHERWRSCRQDAFSCGQHSGHFAEALGWGTAVVLGFQATQLCHQKQRHNAESACLLQRLVSSASSAIPRLLWDTQNWASFGCSSIRRVLPQNKHIPAIQLDTHGLSAEKVEKVGHSDAAFVNQRAEIKSATTVLAPSLFVSRGKEVQHADILSIKELLFSLNKDSIPKQNAECAIQPPSPEISHSDASVTDKISASLVNQQFFAASAGLDVKIDDDVADWHQISREYAALCTNALAVHRAIEGDLAGAVSLWTSVINSGECDKAHFNLGLCYEQGLGVDKDDAKAMDYYSKAAEQGNARAAYNLAMMLLRGEQDDDMDTVVDLLTSAAEQGLAEAQRELGVLFTEEPRQDFTRAAVLFQRAAAQNDVKACFFLGVCLERGLGVAKDTDKAVDVYRTAADHGHSDAQFNLSVLLGNSLPESVKTDLTSEKGLEQKALRTSLSDPKPVGDTTVLRSKFDQDLEHKALMVLRMPRNASSGTMRLLSTGSDDNESSSDSSNDGIFFVRPRQASERSRFNLGNSSSDSEEDDWLEKASKCKERVASDIESLDSVDQSMMLRRRAQ